MEKKLATKSPQDVAPSAASFVVNIIDDGGLKLSPPEEGGGGDIPRHVRLWQYRTLHVPRRHVVSYPGSLSGRGNRVVRCVAIAMANTEIAEKLRHSTVVTHG